MRPTSKQNSAVICIRDNKPFYGFAQGGNIESLALILVSAIFTESKPSPLQVLPIRRAVPTPAVPLGCQTLPVSSVREEVRPQRPPVQTHQSAPLPADQPDGSRRKLSRRRTGVTSGIVCSPRNPWISGAGTGATGAERECTGPNAFGRWTGVRRWEARRVLS